MKVFFNITSFINFLFIKGWNNAQAKTSEEKDLGYITLLKLASEKSKNAGEMVKYEKLKSSKKLSRKI